MSVAFKVVSSDATHRTPVKTQTIMRRTKSLFVIAFIFTPLFFSRLLSSELRPYETLVVDVDSDAYHLEGFSPVPDRNTWSRQDSDIRSTKLSHLKETVAEAHECTTGSAAIVARIAFAPPVGNIPVPNLTKGDPRHHSDPGRSQT